MVLIQQPLECQAQWWKSSVSASYLTTTQIKLWSLRLDICSLLCPLVDPKFKWNNFWQKDFFFSFSYISNSQKCSQHYNISDVSRNLFFLRLILIFLSLADPYKQFSITKWIGFLLLGTAPLSCVLNVFPPFLLCLIRKRAELAATQLQDICGCEATEQLDNLFWGIEPTLHLHLSFSLWVTSVGWHDNWYSLSKTPTAMRQGASHHPDWDHNISGYQVNAGTYCQWPFLFPSSL